MGTQTSYNVNTTETKLPQWYQDYLTNVMGRAVGAAGEAYQPYTGQRVAGMTADQNRAYETIRGIPGSTTPWFNAATDLYNQSGAASSLAGGAGDLYRGAANSNTVDNLSSGAAGAGMFGQASGLYGESAARDTAAMYRPYGEQASTLAYGAGEDASPFLRASTSGLGFSAAQPYLQASTSPMGLSAASPYLGAASQTFPGAASAYMSPYNSGVTDRIAELGARNLSENLLPALSDDFVRAGQYGSTRQRDLVGRALRDTQDSILGQQAQVLESGYKTAGELFGQDQARLAGLAGTAGGLGTSQQQILQGAGSSLGGLGTQQQQLQQGAGTALGNLGLSQAGLLNTIGTTGAGLSAQDAARQLQAAQGLAGIGQAQIQAAQTDYARQQQSRQADLARQIQAAQGITAANQGDYARQIQAGQGLLGVGQAGLDAQLRTGAALEAAGQAQQNQQQRNLDTAYGQFQEQRNYPWQQIGNLSNVIQGLPVNTSTSSTSQTTAPGPSGLSQLAGVGLGVAGLANSGIFKAKGGAVKKSRVSYGVAPRRGLAFYGKKAA